jgi:hypothetical protein
MPAIPMSVPILANAEATVLLAITHFGSDQAERLHDIEIIAARVNDALSFPDEVLEMMRESPLSTGRPGDVSESGPEDESSPSESTT